MGILKKQRHKFSCTVMLGVESEPRYGMYSYIQSNWVNNKKYFHRTAQKKKCRPSILQTHKHTETCIEGAHGLQGKKCHAVSIFCILFSLSFAKPLHILTPPCSQIDVTVSSCFYITHPHNFQLKCFYQDHRPHKENSFIITFQTIIVYTAYSPNI